MCFLGCGGIFCRAETGAVERIEAKADKLDYDRDGGLIEGRGHVVVRKGDEELRADHVKVNTKTEEAEADGDVILKKGDSLWRGNKLTYNFKTKKGVGKDFSGGAGPFRVINVRETEQLGESLYLLRDARITTCVYGYPECHYNVTARKVSLVTDDHLAAHGVVWRFGRIPVIYVPYWYRSLSDDFGFRFRPGHSSRMGAFLLSSLRYRLNPSVKAETHVDLRSERGVGLGQDFKWRLANEGFGSLSTYYADDQKPVDDDEDQQTSDIDSSRYRIRIRNTHNISPRDYVLLQAHYLSDTDIVEDFFEREYREERQPDNYATYTHREDAYTLNATLRARLNDFYADVNRLPELSADFMRRQVAESAFYYEGKTAAAFLERVHERAVTNKEDYSVFRVDSDNMFYRPSKHFGFLNLIPRAGYRATHYSQTLSPDALKTEKGGGLRSRAQLGLETSYKAFKTWQAADDPRRHVVQPYADHTFAPEPTLLPDEIYQFDATDALEKEHQTKIGVRNKLQTRRDGLTLDIADVDIYTFYKFERRDDEDAIEKFYLDGELRPSPAVTIDFDAIFNAGKDGGIDGFNSQVVFTRPGALRANVEYRFRDEESSLLFGDVLFLPGRPWAFDVYGRYEFEEGRLEEQGVYVQRNLDCLAIRTDFSVIPGYTRSDGSERDDEWRFMIEMWITAFPGAEISGKHRN